MRILAFFQSVLSEGSEAIYGFIYLAVQFTNFCFCALIQECPQPDLFQRVYRRYSGSVPAPLLIISLDQLA